MLPFPDPIAFRDCFGQEGEGRGQNDGYPTGGVAVEMDEYHVELLSIAPLMSVPLRRVLYLVQTRTRKSAGSMMRKLSVTSSQNWCQFRGTVSRRKPRIAVLNSLNLEPLAEPARRPGFLGLFAWS